MAGEIQVKFAWSGRARSLRSERAVTDSGQVARIYSDTVKPDESKPHPRDPKALHQRNIRISDEVWNAAQARADEKGETVSEAVRKFLERYAR